jgi:hypothetical protein
MAASRHLVGRGASARIQSVAVLVPALVLCTVLAACSPPAPQTIDLSGSWSSRSIDDHLISLSVPANWGAGEAWTQPSSFTDLVDSFSNQSLSAPCVTQSAGFTCGPPLTSLDSGALLVEVWQNAFPGWTLNSQPGTPTVVSGLPARVSDHTGAHGLCSSLGADRTRSEVIARPNAEGNYLEIDICSRGVPDAVGARITASIRVSPTA